MYVASKMPDKEIDMKHAWDKVKRRDTTSVPSEGRDGATPAQRKHVDGTLVKSSVPAPMFDGCSWVFHNGSHCGRPTGGRYKDMCEVHGMLAI